MKEENNRMIQEMKEGNQLLGERLDKTIQEMKEDTRLLGERLDKTIQDMKEDTRLFKERTDKTIQEMKEENNRMIQEMKEDTRLLGERLDKTIQEMKEDTRLFKEGTDKTIQEMKEDTRIFREGVKVYQDRMNKTIRDMNRRWGELANKMGTVTEDIVAPGFPLLIERHFGLSLDDISCRRKVKDKSGNRWEFDLVARSGNIAFIVDVKSDYNRVEYLDHFTQVVLPKAAELLPDLKECKIIGCIASFRLVPYIIEKASEMGILAISLGGDYLEFCNQEVVESIRQTIREKDPL